MMEIECSSGLDRINSLYTSLRPPLNIPKLTVGTVIVNVIICPFSVNTNRIDNIRSNTEVF